jgi:gamma-glutamyltranspeptidase/glutathione hydrolase
MSPTIVLNNDGEPVYLAGSPGGSRIIGYTAQALVAMMDFGRDPQEAVNTPNYQNRNGPTELEPPIAGVTADFDFEALVEALTLRNHTVENIAGEVSGLSVVEVTADGFLGGADPRRDGTAGGREDLSEVMDGSAATSVTPSVLVGMMFFFAAQVY